MPIKPWKGPEDWSGLAVEGWREFPFHLLPWTTLSERERSEENCTCVKESDSRRVFRIDPLPSAGDCRVPVSETVYAKRYLVNNFRRRMGRLLSGSRTAREFKLGIAMIQAGLCTPQPLACAEHRGTAHVQRLDRLVQLPPGAYLLTRGWRNDGSVRFYIFRNREAAESMAAILARFLAHLHAKGFYHDDCSSEHFLVAPDVDLPRVLSQTASEWSFGVVDSPLAVIDIDNGVLGSKPLGHAERFMNLFQILRSAGPAFTLKPRKAFLAEYLCRSGMDRAYSLKAAREEIEKIAARKIGKSVFKK